MASDETRALAALDPADVIGIQTTLAEYCDRIDRNDIDGLVDLFTPDCRVDFIPGRTLVGRAELHAHLTDRMLPVAATSHHLSNVIVRAEGPDAAQVSSYLYAWHRYVDGRPDGIVWGRYLDRCVRVGGAWSIERRALVLHGAEGFDRPHMHMLNRGRTV